MNAQEWEDESNRVLLILRPHMTDRQRDHVNDFIDEVKAELTKQPLNKTWKETADHFHTLFARENKPRFKATNTLNVVFQFMGFAQRWVPPSDLTIESAPNRRTHRFEVEIEASLRGGGPTGDQRPTKEQIQNVAYNKLKASIGLTDIEFVKVTVL
jgi:hypothetical protein